MQWVLAVRDTVVIRVTTCLENLEMSGNLTAVREMSGILLKVTEMSGKSCLKLFIVSCIFASIQVFSTSTTRDVLCDCALSNSAIISDLVGLTSNRGHK